MTTAPVDAPVKSAAPVGSDGDHDLFSHYVTKIEWDAAYITGRPATALCGKKWVPTKDPEKYPVCPDCKKIYETLP